MHILLTKKAHKKLKDLINRDAHVELSYFLISLFGEDEVFYIHNGLLIELANTIEALCFEDYEEYKELAVPYLKKHIDIYHKEQQKAAKKLSKLTSSDKYWTQHDRQHDGYTDDCITTTLERLDAKYKHDKYTTGYYHDQYIMWSWLLRRFLED